MFRVLIVMATAVYHKLFFFVFCLFVCLFVCFFFSFDDFCIGALLVLKFTVYSIKYTETKVTITMKRSPKITAAQLLQTI